MDPPGAGRKPSEIEVIDKTRSLVYSLPRPGSRQGTRSAGKTRVIAAMYLEHFGLREAPFSLAPDPRYIYLSEQHREALAHLLYGVRSEGGFVQLTGEVGTGKTTVCRCFLEQLPPGTRAAVIFNPRLTAAELLATICDEFEIPRPAETLSVKELLDAINRFLLTIHAAGERAVLVIDEAQNLDAGVLEQLRLLTNLETSRSKLLQIILMGQPELRVTLARTELRQLAQRITARFHLGQLSRAETAAYVRHRLEVAGGSGELFPEALLGRLRRLSRGVPRLINILCERALIGAYAQGKPQVDRVTLDQAAREVGGKTEAVETPQRLAVILAGSIVVLAVLFATFGRRPPPGVSVLTVSATPGASAPKSAAAVSTAAGARPAPAAPVVSPGGPDVLRALMEQPEAGSEQEAWRWLFRLWGIRAHDGENGCAQALVHGLDCLRGEGGLELLGRLDRPAILRLQDAQGSPRWLVLERLRAGQATLVAMGARTVVQANKLDRYVIKGFVLLWRPPSPTGSVLTAGDRGPGVAWLLGRLGRAAGARPGAAGPVYDETVVRLVREFQRAQGLEVDGVAGPAVLLALDKHPEPGTPTLTVAQ